MRMFNPDGSEAEMCGNGLRCFGRWLLDRGELPGGTAPDDAPVAVETAAGAAVETAAGVLAIRIADGGWFTIDMGRPRLAPVEIPLAPEAARGQPPDGPVLHLPLRVRPAGGAEETFDATCVSMGNPHAVVFVPEVDAVPLESIGPLLERHAAFPARANVEVCQVVNRERLRVRVWERGAGITLACGTGACAALVAARLHGHVEPAARLEVPGGELGVTWRGGSGGADGAPVYLSGPAEHVFDGTIGREASW